MRRTLLIGLPVLAAATSGLVYVTHRATQRAAEEAPAAGSPPTGKRVPGFRRLTGITALAVLEAHTLAAGDATGRVALRRLEAREDAPAPEPAPLWWAAHDAPIRRIWALADGGVATASADGSVGEWNPDGGLRVRFRLRDAHLNDAVPRPGDRTVFVAADRGTVARLCDPEPCWWHMGVHGAAAFAVALSPDAEHLATGGMDGQLVLRSPTTGESEGRWSNGPGWVTALAWTAEGLFAGGNGGRVTFMAGGHPESTPEIMEVGAGPVLILVAGGTVLLAGTEDGQLAAISRTDRRVLARVDVGSPVRALATMNDTVYTGSADGSVRRFKLTPTALVAGEPMADALPDPPLGVDSGEN